MNGMKAQLLTATLFTAFSGALSAADPQLLNLVMPDAKVLAGVNVEQAKGTQFGQYVLNQLQSEDAHMQQLVTLTGFDPRRDVRELLVASDGVPGGKTGLALARGNFDVAKITAAATLQGAASEVYNSITILEDPKKQSMGIAFLDSTTVVAGDIASVKGAIDRMKIAQPLPAAVLVKVNQWSNSQDAWGITTVPPASLAPPMKTAKRQCQSHAQRRAERTDGGGRREVRRAGGVQRRSAVRHRTERDHARRRGQTAGQSGADAGGSGPDGGGADQVGECDCQRQRGDGFGQPTAGRVPADAAAPQEDGDGGPQAISQGLAGSAWPAGQRSR